MHHHNDALKKIDCLTWTPTNKQKYTDGSPVGISVLLTQEGQVIQFASRALTRIEQRYTQRLRNTFHHMSM